MAACPVSTAATRSADDASRDELAREKLSTKCLQNFFYWINVSPLHSSGQKIGLDTWGRCARFVLTHDEHCPDRGMSRKKMSMIAAPGGTRINQELMDRLRSSTTGSKSSNPPLQQFVAARSFSSRSPRLPLSAGGFRRAPLSRIHEKTVRGCLFYMATRSSVGGFRPLASLQVP